MTNSISGHREARSRNKKVLPDQGVTRVFIDSKTYIIIKKGQDPEERKAAYLHRIFLQEKRDKKSK